MSTSVLRAGTLTAARLYRTHDLPANRATGLITACDKRYTHKENPDMQLRGVKYVATVGGAVAVALLAACSSGSSSSSSSTGATSAPASTSSSAASAASGKLNGAGSTFQLTFQQAAISAYKSVASGVTVNYDGVGSGSGRADLYAGTVNFAGSDSPIPPTEEAKLNGKKVLYFPILIGPITMAYNLPGVSNLKLTPTLISDIFQAKITTWNDPAIKAAQPGRQPAQHADHHRRPLGLLRHHAELHAVPAGRRRQRVGAWQQLDHQVAVHGPRRRRQRRRRDGRQVDGRRDRLRGLLHRPGLRPDRRLRREQGGQVRRALDRRRRPLPRPGSRSAPNLTFHAVWASTDPTAYPITYQTWDIVYAMQPNATDASLLKGYLGFLLGQQGQALLAPLHYAPLPSNIDSMATAQLSQITS